MLQAAYLIRFGLIFIVVGGVGTSQTAVRWATRSEVIDIEKAVQRLVSAANNRDAKAAQAGTTAIFDAAGEGWAFNREGMAPWSARKAESLAAAELRVLLRHAQMLSDEVAVADGYFRTTRLPAGDLSGNVTATMVKREGVWLVSTVRFAPIQSSLAMTPVKIAKDHPAAPSPDGWVILFTGKSVDGFLSPGSSGRSDSWKIKDGLLTNSPSNGMPRQGLLTKDTYTSFELEFDWKIASKGNSGIKYRLFYLTDSDAAGYEYQLADDAGDPGALRSSRERSGALYGVLPPMKSVVKPAGEFNHSVLVVRGRHCEHWLNGEKVVDYETDSEPLESPILLQHHGSDVWFRNIRIRRLQ